MDREGFTVGRQHPAVVGDLAHPDDAGVRDVLRRAFGTDVLACARPGGRMMVLATVDDPVEVRRIRTHLGGQVGKIGLDKSREGVVRPAPAGGLRN